MADKKKTEQKEEKKEIKEVSKKENKDVKKEVKKKDTKKKEKTKKEKKHTESYLRQVQKEMKLVKWPKFSEVIKYTISTVILCLFICGLFILLNLALSIVKGWFV